MANITKKVLEITSNMLFEMIKILDNPLSDFHRNKREGKNYNITMKERSSLLMPWMFQQ